MSVIKLTCMVCGETPEKIESSVHGAVHSECGGFVMNNVKYYTHVNESVTLMITTDDVLVISVANVDVGIPKEKVRDFMNKLNQLLEMGHMYDG